MNMTPLSGSNKIVVVGGGAAGMMAAGMAAQAGAQVTLLEQNGRLGKKLLITGKGRCNVTNDCPWQDVLQSVPTNPRFLYSALAGFSPADAKKFFEDYGCVLKTERGNRVFPVSDRSQSVLDALERFLRAYHVRILPRKAAEIAVSDGRVTGVIIRDAQNDNKYIQLNASKGVILATGDNSGDEKIMKHFAPEIVEKKIANMGAMGMLGVDVEGKTVETGDGLRMGAWIGAKVQDHHAPITHHMGSGMGITPFLQLNKRGERFMNECIPGQQLENQIELQPECTSFQLYDSKWGEEVPYMPANHGGLCYIIPEDEDESNPNYTDRQYTKISAKAEAYQFKADTLEDLLTQCGFEGDALDNALASVERYNELAKAGSDDDFGKPASRMFALENPPYYACQWGTTSMLVCVGGLESDENCHTFTEEDPASPKRDIIKGLYVCGNVQGSRYAVEYPICMRGISHSLCVYYGYIAGKNCVAGV